MTLVAAALVAALIVTVLSFTALTRSLVRSHARERDLLLDKLMHLAGRTWTPPPADEWHTPTDGEPLVTEWTATPEQHPY